MCFSLELLKELAIWAIVVIGVIALIRLVFTPIVAQLGSWGGVLIQALGILMWVIVGIIVVTVIFALLGCLFVYLPHSSLR